MSGSFPVLKMQLHEVRLPIIFYSPSTSSTPTTALALGSTLSFCGDAIVIAVSELRLPIDSGSAKSDCKSDCVDEFHCQYFDLIIYELKVWVPVKKQEQLLLGEAVAVAREDDACRGVCFDCK